MRRTHPIPTGESCTFAHVRVTLDETMLHLGYFGSGGISALGSGSDYEPSAFHIG